MGSPWRALSDDNRRKILRLLGKKDSITPIEIAEYFRFTLPAVSIQLRILNEAGRGSREKIGEK